MKMHNNSDLKAFSQYLADELAILGKTDFVEDLQKWSRTSCTTASEYLGEFRMILERILLWEEIDNRMRKDVEACMEEIRKALQYR